MPQSEINREDEDILEEEIPTEDIVNEENATGTQVRILDQEEIEAEENAEELMDMDDTYELIFGKRDDIEERKAFEEAGINIDESDAELIDYSKVDETSERDAAKARRAAERQMETRDILTEKKNKLRKHRKTIVTSNSLNRSDIWADLYQNQEEDDILENVLTRVHERRNKYNYSQKTIDIDINVITEAKKLLTDSTPRNTIVEELHKAAIDALFQHFIYTFKQKDNNNSKVAYYVNQIEKMILNDSKSLYVNTSDLRYYFPDLLHWIEYYPHIALSVMSDTITVEFRKRAPEIYHSRNCVVRFINWIYSTSVSNLRCHDLNTLIQVTGVVTSRSSIQPKLKVLHLMCTQCGIVMNEQPIYFSEAAPTNLPNSCPCCQSSTFTIDRLRTIYYDYQILTIQESPENVPAGRPPRSKEVIVTDELADRVRPGEQVNLVGIYQSKYDVNLNIKAGFTVLGTEIFANNIQSLKEGSIGEITQEDLNKIIELSKDPHIRERIIASIAPILYGHHSVKTAIAYAMFGGIAKGSNYSYNAENVSANENLNRIDKLNQDYLIPFNGNSKGNHNPLLSGHKIRGDINVLLIGDPGLGKSQILQYVSKTVARVVSTTGKGASAAGLTAAVKKSKNGEWVLEGGALVLADDGICLIDEFDKMTDRDRVSIHEAMEQQSISISKAGIVTTLKARCCVIAAANPKFGRYIPSFSFKENVALDDPILSRFDMICVMRDIPNEHDDSNLAEYVTNMHRIQHPYFHMNEKADAEETSMQKFAAQFNAFEPINQNLLQKYILYARNHCKPSITYKYQSQIEEKIAEFYASTRRTAAATGGMPLTLRHVEGVIRLAEANAKMRLSNFVSVSDVEMGIAVMLDNFISSQKFAVAHKLSKEFIRYRLLVRGGNHVLSEIVYKAMYRCTKKKLFEQYCNTDLIGDSDNAAPTKDKMFMPLDDLYNVAQNNKFDRYSVDKWFESNTFSMRFKFITLDNVRGIAAA